MLQETEEQRFELPLASGERQSQNWNIGDLAPDSVLLTKAR
jgi:hypothetical protein